MIHTLQRIADAIVTFEVPEALDEDTFRVTGSFGGVLALRADFSTRPDPENSVTIEGTFDFAKMTREPEGE